MKHSLRLNSGFMCSVFSEKNNNYFFVGVKGQVSKPLIDSGGVCVTSEKCEQKLVNLVFF